jgi:DNA repair protein RadC
MIVEENKPQPIETTDNHKTIKQLHTDERPREKALRLGYGALTLPELWALVLGSGTRGKNVIELCSDLMQRNGYSLATLARRSLRQMLEIKGLGPKKAMQVMAVMEISRRVAMELPADEPAIRTSEDIYRLMSPRIANLPHEEVWAIFLSRSNKVKKLFKASQGGTASSVFDVKMILKDALLEQAEGLILCHNHPSGNLNPSPQDDAITASCKSACATLDIRFLDHVIVATTGFYSYIDHSRI